MPVRWHFVGFGQPVQRVANGAGEPPIGINVDDCRFQEIGGQWNLGDGGTALRHRPRGLFASNDVESPRLRGLSEEYPQRPADRLLDRDAPKAHRTPPGRRPGLKTSLGGSGGR